MKIAPGFKFASRTGERCTRNAAVVEQRNGKEVRLCRHHRQKGAFKPWGGA